MAYKANRKLTLSPDMKRSRFTTWMIIITFLSVGMMSWPVPAWCVAADGHFRMATGLSCIGQAGERSCHLALPSDDGYDDCGGCTHFPAFAMGLQSQHVRCDGQPSAFPAWVSAGWADFGSCFAHIPGRGLSKGPVQCPGLLGSLRSVVLII